MCVLTETFTVVTVVAGATGAAAATLYFLYSLSLDCCFTTVLIDRAILHIFSSNVTVPAGVAGVPLDTSWASIV